MRKNLLAVMTATMFVGASQAQEVACRVNNYTLHKGLKNAEMPVQGLEIGYIKHLSKVFDVYLPVRLGPRGEVKKTINSDIIKTQMQGTAAADIAIQAKYDNGHNFLIPFVSVGTGIEWYHNGLELGAPVGGGLNFRAAPRVLVSLATNYRFPMTSTSPEGFCHSLGVIINLKGKEEKPFMSKMPENKTNSAEDYAKMAAEAQAKRDAEAQAQAKRDADAIEKAKKEAEAIAKANEEMRKKRDAEIAAEKAKAEEVTRAKMQASVPVVVSSEVQKVLNYALKGVQFETGSAQLTQSSFSILDEVATTMAKNPDLRISIEGHTDRTGNESINMKLSEARAKTCRSYLMTKGINGERLKESGFGSTRPISDNDTPEGRTLNRRVEFVPF